MVYQLLMCFLIVGIQASGISNFPISIDVISEDEVLYG